MCWCNKKKKKRKKLVMKNGVEYLLSHFCNMHVFSMLISERCAFATRTAESFPYECVNFPTPRARDSKYLFSLRRSTKTLARDSGLKL